MISSSITGICTKWIDAKLTDAGPGNDPPAIAGQRTFTGGHIIIIPGVRARLGKQKRAGDRSRFTREFPAVIETKLECNTLSTELDTLLLDLLDNEFKRGR